MAFGKSLTLSLTRTFSFFMRPKQRKIKALVLTYDRNRPLTENMILQYSKVWPSHPFEFIIPYQKITGGEPNRTYIRSPPGIQQTINNLLSTVADDEWIYWCVDDKYPVSLRLPVVEKITDRILTTRPESISGILFCRCRDLLEEQNVLPYTQLVAENIPLLERANYHQIWIHQFLQAKVLKDLFRRFPTDKPMPHILDPIKDQLYIPPDQRLFVTASNYAVFGESSVKGRLTRNCLDSLRKNGIDNSSLEPSKLFDQEVFLGKL